MTSIKNVVIGIAILVLTIFVVVYGVGVFYDSPEYDDFCGDGVRSSVDNEAECVALGGQWTGAIGQIEGDAPTKEGWCDTTYECRQEYEDAQEVYSRNIFLMALPIGIILIVVGIVVFGLEVVGAGLAGGGIGIILWGVGGYWRYGSDILKFSLSLVGLVAVIWLAYWFNKRKK
jgi:hypothetical protein